MQIRIHALYEDNETDAKPDFFLKQTHNNIDSSSNNVLNTPDIALSSGLVFENIMDKIFTSLMLRMLAEQDTW